VHLTRDPIRFAFSMASHGHYSHERDDNYTRHAVLQPDDPGVVHRDYALAWPGLNPVERSLFHWLELNGFGEEMAQRGQIALRLRSEDVFADPAAARSALRGLHRHWQEILGDAPTAAQRVDRFQFPVSAQIHGVRYSQAVADLAGRLGYSVDLEGQRQELIRRFFSVREGGGA